MEEYVDMGYQVTYPAKVGGSHLGPPLLSGGENCSSEDKFKQCDVDKPQGHFIFDAWGGGATSHGSMDPDIRPTMSKIGYLGYEGTFVPDGAISKGLAMNPPVFVDFYRFLNSSLVDPTSFLASQQDVEAKIQERGTVKAECGRDSLKQGHLGCTYYEEFTGDKDMYTWSGPEDSRVCSLVCQNQWILSPACRQNPTKCVAWVSTGDGWGIEEMMQQAVFWNIALAMVVLPAWGDYTTLPLKTDTLWFWFFPDPSFMAISPKRLMEPATDESERRKNLYKTGADSITITKFLWRKLEFVAPEVNAFLLKVKFTLGDTYVMMNNASVGQDLGDIACAWVRENRARWKEWVPSRVQCANGRGLVQASTDKYLNSAYDFSQVEPTDLECRIFTS